VTFWIDGDACPKPARRIVFRAAERLAVPARIVANRDVLVPRSPWIRAVKVARGLDGADQHILRESSPGDVAITDDVPLAAALVSRGVHVLSLRGEAFTLENVGERLATRDLLQSLREQGLETGGPAPYREADARQLANALDRLLARLAQGTGPY
jgi:uncharacterized protein YaiI (UPF0178 family)